MRSAHYDTAIRNTIAPAVYGAATDGATVDRLGFETVSYAVMVGAGGDTFTTTKRIDVALEASDDGVTFDPVDDAEIAGVSLVTDGVILSLQAAHPDASATSISYIGNKRYTRLSLAFNGTHAAGTPISAVAMLGRAHSRPVEV